MIGTPPPSEVPAPLPDGQASTEAPSDFEQLVSPAPIHARDRVPRWMLRAQGWLFDSLPYERRSGIAIVVVVMAIFVAAAHAGARLLLDFAGALDIVAFAGLFVVNWVGNGGALVPIPGTRIIGLLLIFQQAVVLPSMEVFAVGGAAMALGLLTYYLAGARSANYSARGEMAPLDAAVADSTTSATSDAAAQSRPDYPVAVPPAVTPAEVTDAGESVRRRLRARFSVSWKHAQERAQPVIEQRGTVGMFWLCFAPSPVATAAAFLGGALGFGFSRYLLASFASKYALAALIVLAALILSQQARSMDLLF